MAVLEFDSVGQSYGSVRALDGVTLAIQPGEVLGLLGPNGAGKSTLMHLASGLLKPDEGSVRLAGGADPCDPTSRYQIGLAPQSMAVYDELTAAENLSFVGRCYGLRGARLASRVEWALQVAGLSDRAHHRTKTFSGGMKRRLNLVCALLHDPGLALLDEPTVGVDAQSRAHLFEMIGRLRDEGKSVIYATHYMEEASRLADRVAIIDHGRCIALGSVEELMQEYGGDAQVELRPSLPLPDGTSLPSLDADGCVRWQTSRPLDDLVRLSKEGVDWEEVSISRPDLESVFLKLTGRSLRDGDEPALADETSQYGK